MKENNLISDIRAMSDKELVVFKNELLMEESKINEEYTDEVASFATENFDPTSYWGEKKISKTAKKYAEKSSGIDYLLELVYQELNRRSMLVTHFGEGADEDQSLEEFLAAEETKTMAHRADLDE